MMERATHDNRFSCITQFRETFFVVEDYDGDDDNGKDGDSEDNDDDDGEEGNNASDEEGCNDDELF